MVDKIERKIYSIICSHDGVKAREIARLSSADHTTVNHWLYSSPFMRDLCYQDQDYCWHGLIRQGRRHVGLEDFSGFYSTVGEFLALGEEEWFSALLSGCRRIGRNLNDTRGLFHSFKDSRAVMQALFRDLSDAGLRDFSDWEIVFELRIRRSRMIRIYADVLVITGNRVFSLEFKMKDEPEPEEVLQAAKYCEYLEVIFGPEYDVIPALVLTAAEDRYEYVPLGSGGAELPVASGDMLFNLFDEYLGLLEE